MDGTLSGDDSPDPRPEVLETIRSRRTVRHFDPTVQVRDDVLRTVLEHARFAPSAFNLQPWRFLIVRDARNRRRLRAFAGNQPSVSEAPVVVIVLAYRTPASSHLEPILESAREAGAITAAEAAELRGRARSWADRHDDPAGWAGRTSMLAAATLMLAAEAMGVGSALLEVSDEASLRDEFGIPDDHGVCCLIALGYPSSPAAFPGRLSLAELCHGEHFGAPLRLADEADAIDR